MVAFNNPSALAPALRDVSISAGQGDRSQGVGRVLQGGGYFYDAQASPNWMSNAVERFEVRVTPPGSSCISDSGGLQKGKRSG